MKQNGWWLLGTCLYAGSGVILYLVIKGGAARPDPDPDPRIEARARLQAHVHRTRRPYDWARDDLPPRPYDWAQN